MDAPGGGGGSSDRGGKGGGGTSRRRRAGGRQDGEGGAAAFENEVAAPAAAAADYVGGGTGGGNAVATEALETILSADWGMAPADRDPADRDRADGGLRREAATDASSGGSDGGRDGQRRWSKGFKKVRAWTGHDSIFLPCRAQHVFLVRAEMSTNAATEIRSAGVLLRSHPHGLVFELLGGDLSSVTGSFSILLRS